MNTTLEAIEKVMEQTGVEYKAAKEALLKTDGDPDAAINLIQPDTKDISEDIKEAIDKLKKKVEDRYAQSSCPLFGIFRGLF